MANYAVPLQIPTSQFFDSAGAVLNGGKLYAYEAGTSNTKTTWADGQMQTPNANPVILDSTGRAAIFVQGLYKFILATSADVVIATLDYCWYPPITGTGAGLINATSAAYARSALGLGTAAALDTGTTAGNVLVFTTTGRLPASDGSLLTNLATIAYGSSTYYRSGLALSRGGATTLGIAKGCTRDDTDTVDMALSGAWTKVLTAWVAATGNGGLDSGAIANDDWYHVFIIAKAAGADEDIVFTAALSPTLPTDYLYKRLLGSFLTNGSAQITDF